MHTAATTATAAAAAAAALRATVRFEDPEPCKFTVTAYFAVQFHELRRRTFAGGEASFVQALSRCDRWHPAGGKSSVFFARSRDCRLIIKQLSRAEVSAVHEIGPAYFRHMAASFPDKAQQESSSSPPPLTCLAKQLGWFTIDWRRKGGNGGHVRMDVAVMEDVLGVSDNDKSGTCFDLKGSTRGRLAPKSSPTWLDENLLAKRKDDPLLLADPHDKNRLSRALYRDTALLASLGVMDFSLICRVDKERRLICAGLVDYMRTYTWDKQLESYVKASGILGGGIGRDPTVVSPRHYKRRFRDAVLGYFTVAPAATG